MKGRPTLYELLGVPQSAATHVVQAAYRHALTALEAQRATLKPEDFSDRLQLLRLAHSTLSDPVSRMGYDAELEAAASAARSSAANWALSARAETPATGADVRAEALSLRADALSLRADAMLARAGIEGASARQASSVPWGLLAGAKSVVRALGLLMVIGALTFGVTRCSMNGSTQQRSALEARAAEQTALQEYFQTHGVRPANMAEMELMEAARRGKANDARLAEQERRRQAEELRRFEEESRRRADEVSRELRLAEEEARRQAERDRERDQELKFREEQLRLEAELAPTEAERRRLELQRQQLRQRLQKP